MQNSTQNMLVSAVRKPGGPDAVQMLQLPVPSPRKGEVLVEIHASSLNPADVKLRSGEFLPVLMKNPKVAFE